MVLTERRRGLLHHTATFVKPRRLFFRASWCPPSHHVRKHAARHPVAHPHPRSFISLRIAREGGDGLHAVDGAEIDEGFSLVLGDFFVSGVAASVVNSALKYLTNAIRRRLSFTTSSLLLPG